MTVTPFQALACPLDGKPLQRAGHSLRCASGHCFDLAAQGYANLLPVQNKRSIDPGDSKEMVAARQRFLGAGHYAPIAQAVSRATLMNLTSDAPASCLDAGCGEGYYLRQLAATAAQKKQSLTVLGLDISKWAILSAAKQNKQAAWVVGSNAALPVLSDSLDRILCMFGFPVYTEFARTLKAGGVLLQVDSGPDHLRELREIIYPSLKAARSSDAAAAPTGFKHVTTDSLQFSIHISDAAAIADLLTMTPHLYRASAEGRAKAAALHEITLSVDVRLARFERKH